ncbi:MAG: hypothetical protein L0Y80_07935, partial [Ignavibacteriae bacterium]|nr:hypothetical protein [Ignavibacteriota bacterium]
MLHRVLLLITLALLTLSVSAFAQDAMEDVVYLKNGGIIRGTIVEQVPGKSVKIKTRDGNVFVYSMDEIDKMTKEESRQMGMTHPSSSFDFSLVTGGAVYDGFYFGTGVRLGATIDPGFYIGATVVNHFSDEVDVSYLGADLGFNVRADKITFQPYASLGTILGGGES